MVSPFHGKGLELNIEDSLDAHVASGIICGFIAPMYCIGTVVYKTAEGAVRVVEGKNRYSDLPDLLTFGTVVVTLPLTLPVGFSLLIPGAIGGVVYYGFHRIKLARSRK